MSCATAALTLACSINRRSSQFRPRKSQNRAQVRGQGWINSRNQSPTNGAAENDAAPAQQQQTHYSVGLPCSIALTLWRKSVKKEAHHVIAREPRAPGVHLRSRVAFVKAEILNSPRMACRSWTLPTLSRLRNVGDDTSQQLSTP